MARGRPGVASSQPWTRGQASSYTCINVTPHQHPPTNTASACAPHLSSAPLLINPPAGMLKKHTGRELPIDACPIRFGS